MSEKNLSSGRGSLALSNDGPRQGSYFLYSRTCLFNCVLHMLKLKSSISCDEPFFYESAYKFHLKTSTSCFSTNSTIIERKISGEKNWPLSYNNISTLCCLQGTVT